MSETSIIPYLFFGGRAEEALDFYTKQLGAKVDMVMRFSESPVAAPPGMLQDGFENKVMHASFQIHGITLFASDGCDDKSTFSGFRLALTLPTAAEVTKAFNALAEGGKVDMPLVETFWSPLYGQVTDKFNLGWMLMVPTPPMPPTS
ncbi:3-demethylubiquinone-9 3-methyltransferase [Pirellula staleyi DSM 6068]|uniref:3-demethylubiquinone-9 3-methyltransferase n=1 Tax=Pirellula staleyi (strain ATCC 27377 / DSM 6068 / ICPB 4128) TaxID=530564 RepID=D2R692_PIRSD|nr:VOC family protein [Pirellula staleyi]ADB15470.1 3-demethylubiquinone-9 3-methyltransferase [Pirellula staleyi DSM 6068]